MPSQNRPNPSLPTLPIEILHIVASLLDKTSLIELSRVHRLFLPLITPDRLWHTLNLFVPDEYGEQPLIQPYERSKRAPYVAWARAEARAAEDRNRQGTKEKIRMVLRRGGEEEWRMVRVMRVTPNPGSVVATVQALDLATNLTRLTILTKRWHRFELEWAPHGYETLDARITDSGIRFPSLTFLRLNSGAISEGDTILRLVELSPNLEQLMVDFEPYDIAVGDPPIVAPLPANLHHTFLRIIRFVFNHQDGFDQLDRQAAAILRSLVRRSPLLEQLIVHGLDTTSVDGDIVTMLEGHSALRDLYLPLSAHVFHSARRDFAGFKSLRRLILKADTWVDAVGTNMDRSSRYELKSQITNLPTIPHVEEIYFDGSLLPVLPIPSLTDTSFPLPINIIPPTLAAQLRANPSLRVIHTIRKRVDNDDLDLFSRVKHIEARGGIEGFVSSLRHGGEELLLVDLYRDLVEVADTPWPIAGASFSSSTIQVPYRANDRSKRAKVFARRPAPTWFLYTEFRGLMVPHWVIERMKQTGGAGMEAQRSRGVEVSEEAWAVLSAWHAGNLTEDGVVQA